VLNSFSGYIHLVPRVFAELFTTISLELTPLLTWLTATLVWSIAAWTVFAAISTVSSSLSAGAVGAAAFVLSPSSNIILLGQLNALQWPMLLACTIVAVTMYRPHAAWARLAIVGLFILTAFSAALTFLVIGLLALGVFRPEARRYALHLLIATAVPYTLQVVTYFGQDSRQVETHAFVDLLREALYAFRVIVPGGLRNDPTSLPPTRGLILIIALWVVLVGGLVFAIIRQRISAPEQARVTTLLLAAGLVFLIVSVYFNGNLNHQYLVVPYGCLWSASAIGFSSIMGHTTTRLVGQLATFVAVGIFAFSSMPLLNKSLEDPFFVQPFVDDWSAALDEAIMRCARSDIDTINISGPSESFVLPCDAID